MKFATLALLLGCTLPSAAATPKFANLQADAEAARAAYGPLAPTAGVVVVECGEVNAFYSVLTDTVVMCSELAPLGDDTVTFIVAHEFAHALVTELGIPNYDGEAAADELGAIILLDAGKRSPAVAAADFMLGLADPTPDDPHPASMERARNLLCLDDGVDGAEASDPNCALYLKRARSAWIRVILDAVSHA